MPPRPETSCFFVVIVFLTYFPLILDHHELTDRGVPEGDTKDMLPFINNGVELILDDIVESIMLDSACNVEFEGFLLSVVLLPYLFETECLYYG